MNQPVRNIDTGRVEITSYNHGFAVDPGGWRLDGCDMAQTSLGRSPSRTATSTTARLEGIRCLDVPAFGVQYHPESAPGPHDSRYLFEDFRALMAGEAPRRAP